MTALCAEPRKKPVFTCCKDFCYSERAESVAQISLGWSSQGRQCYVMQNFLPIVFHRILKKRGPNVCTPNKSHGVYEENRPSPLNILSCCSIRITVPCILFHKQKSCLRNKRVLGVSFCVLWPSLPSTAQTE